MDVRGTIDILIQKLRMKGTPERVLDETIDEINTRIGNAVEDAVVQAYYEAKEIGDSRDLDKFTEELEINRFGSQPSIGTRSGQTDFSTPPFPMLPKLLKNAKIAKDGSRYKIIPIKKKGTTSLTKQQTTNLLDTQRVMNTLNETRRQMKQNKQERRMDPTNRPTTFNEINSRIRSVKKAEKAVMNSNRGTDFRVASDKQDAGTQWVNPGKDGDMRQVLSQINRDLDRQITDIVRSVLDEYERFL